MSKSYVDSADIATVALDNTRELTNNLEYVATKTASQRKKDLEEELRKYKKIDDYQRSLKKEFEREQLVEDLAYQEKLAKNAKTLKERQNAADEVQRLQRQKDEDDAAAAREEKVKKNAVNLKNEVLNTVATGISSMYSSITNAAKTYSGYVDRIQTRLLGANETYSSIAEKLSQTFGASPFFKLQSVMETTAQFVEKGISFNIENRAAMQVISDKVAQTFNAFDSNLLRLVRIQQEDSTRARLGMESVLTEFLNREYQDTSYLQSLSTTVQANLLEASAIKGTEGATEFEFAAQKWLGSLSSVGASDNLISKLSQGLGYLGSGNVSGLTSDSALSQLFVRAANAGGGREFGDILTTGATSADVISLMHGLHSLVTDITKSGNIVALNQYAQVFGMSMSDITSVMNLTSQNMADIAEDMKSYSQLVDRVAEETTFSKLFSRTGGASIGDNLYQNFLGGAGKAIGSNAASFLSWQLAGVVSSLLAGVETGVDLQPLGVGTHLNLSVGDIMKAATVAGGVATGLVSMMQGLKPLSVSLDALKSGEETRANVSRGKSSMIESGTSRSSTTYVGDFSSGALASGANAVTGTAAAQYTDADFNEEKEKTKKTQQAIEDIGDNVKFIVQLLNESGIVIRGRVGTVSPETLFDDLASFEKASELGGAVLGGRI